jgi:flagellar hook-length control protein FliK
MTSSTGFDAVLSSFIEDGRYDYCARPPGFSAYGETNGTLDGETAALLAATLRERKVSEDSVGRLEALAASGSPLTIGTAFIALSGRSRQTPVLEDAERDAFKNLLARAGFSRDEAEEMLSLSDDGDGNAMWKRLNAKLKQLDGVVDVSREEWHSLLRGLDLSDSTRKTLLGLFQGESLTLDGSQMEALLAGAAGEFAAREAAARHARTEMRGAMEEALRAAKIKELATPEESARGTRVSGQKEEMMQASVRKNTGSDEIKQDAPPEGEENFESRKDGDRDGKSRSERILTLEKESAPAGSRNGEAANDADKGAPLQKFARSIDLAAAVPQQTVSPDQAQNLNRMTGAFRQEIFSQVEQGILQSAQNGSGRLTLQLAPAELGQVTVILSVVEGEVKALIRAENQESADALRAQMAELKISLEAQGLKVKELDVQTGLQDNAFAGHWDGHDEHNLMRDADERSRMLRLSRIRREAGGSAAPGGQSAATIRTSNESGLHIVA